MPVEISVAAPEGQAFADDPVMIFLAGFYRGTQRQGELLPVDLAIPPDDEFIAESQAQHPGQPASAICDAIEAVWDQFNREYQPSDLCKSSFWLGALIFRNRMRAQALSIEVTNG
jgi:hypothetical protein